MIGNFSTYQVLEMMSDEDFAYLAEFSPESIDHMCIALTIELLTEGEKKPN